MKRRYSTDGLQQRIKTARAASLVNSNEASKLWLAASQYSEMNLGVNHARTNYCYNQLGVALIAAEDYERAISILRERLTYVRAIHGRVHYCVEHICQSLARAYRATGEVALQSACWLEAASSSEHRRGISHSTTLFCYHQAARSLIVQGETDSALVILKKLFEVISAEDDKQVRLAYIARDIARSLDLVLKHEEAIGWWLLSIQHFESASEAHAGVRQKSEAAMCESLLKALMAKN
jgi:tetratricopeptide (TPR) repeat protein